MATSGNQLTRIGGYLSGIAKKLTILAKAVGVDPAQASFAVQSLISDEGQAVRSAFDTTGASVAVTGFSSFAVQSAITTDGVSVRSAFDTDGASVTGKMQG